MAFTALDSPYILSDESAKDLLAMEREGSAPVSSIGFVSRAADSARLTEIVASLAERKFA
jgi:hypothetical protein